LVFLLVGVTSFQERRQAGKVIGVHGSGVLSWIVAAAAADGGDDTDTSFIGAGGRGAARRGKGGGRREDDESRGTQISWLASICPKQTCSVISCM
jgi:hypothetical protein